MKKIIIGLTLLSSVSTYADSTVDKILASSEVAKAVSLFESTHNVDCIAPKEHQIDWMCTGGGGCGFSLDITCVSRIDTFESNDKIVRLSISGDTFSGDVKFSPKDNIVTEYKKLERK